MSFLWHTLSSGHGHRPRSSEKADPRPLEKLDPKLKFIVWVKSLYLTISDFKYDESFLEILAQKYSNKTFLGPNLGLFILARNFTVRQI